MPGAEWSAHGRGGAHHLGGVLTVLTVGVVLGVWIVAGNAWTWWVMRGIRLEIEQRSNISMRMQQDGEGELWNAVDALGRTQAELSKQLAKPVETEVKKLAKPVLRRWSAIRDRIEREQDDPAAVKA